MHAIQVLAAVTALTGGGETVLLDFSATWCGPCRAMAPVVEQLAAEGLPVRKVDIDQNRALAAKYNVQGIPCFVMLVDGQEVDRVVGGTSVSRLRQMLAQAGSSRPNEGVSQIRGQSPDGRGAAAAPRPWSSQQSSDDRLADSPRQTAPSAPLERPAKQTPQPASRQLVARLLRASVRLRIDERDGYSWGSGTIIDQRPGEALVLTCGHLFRESAGRGEITVEIVDGERMRKYRGRLIDFDDRRDVGLVSFRPDFRVETVPLATADARLKIGQVVVSVGCDNGQRPTARQGRILALNSFVGPSNVKVSGRPVQGRSGGGLFALDGSLVGVCNFADPSDDAGVYAAPNEIGAMLDRGPSGDEQAIASNGPDGRPRDDRSRLAPASYAEPANGTAGDGVEVVCIVRPRGDHARDNEVIHLHNASPALLRQIAQEQQRQSQHYETSLSFDTARSRPTGRWQPQWRAHGGQAPRAALQQSPWVPGDWP